jgi:hypothetical protein
MNHLHGYSLSDHDLKLEEINTAIIKETDLDKRGIFMILQSHAIALTRITNVLEDISNHNTEKIDAHDLRLINLDKINARNETALKIGSGIFGLTQAIVIGIFLYGYALVANMRDQITSQAVLLPRIEAMANESRLQRISIANSKSQIDANSDKLQQQQDDNKTQEDNNKEQEKSNQKQNTKMESLGKDIIDIQHKKVIQESRNVK